MSGSAYKKSGVDIDAGNDLVRRIKPEVAKTKRSGVMGGLGGFGALFDLKAAGYRDPILVSATDGVGTKLKIAIETGLHDGIGQDLVAMCVNDLVVQGAEPLFFLDYFATGHLNVDHAEAVINGIARGCTLAGCALVGGETAEMPGMYGEGDYDLAGFAVGAVERDAMIDGANVAAGDVVLGMMSSGIHSNGYSLVRRIVKDMAGLDYTAPAPFDTTQTLAQILLTPTRIYTKSLVAVMKAHPAALKAMAHITGGGLMENIPRVLPDNTEVVLDASAWAMPSVFKWMKSVADLSVDELARTFNCGIGMVVVVDAAQAVKIQAALEDHGEQLRVIGHVRARTTSAEQVILQNVEAAWKA